ncbi:MAG: rubredoxin [Mycoplasmataceae bacterium]|jgi:pyruvate oxidase|nr:rubredoxin [Mycoplasmataceae bacterium]
MAKYKCILCGYTYDETNEGKSFESLPADYICPICGADKTQFKKV